MKTLRQLLEETKGTYAGVRYDKTTREFINSISSNYANPIEENDIHSTLLYSRKYLPDYVPLGSIKEEAFPFKFEIFKNEGSNVLVLLIKSKWLEERHNYLSQIHSTTWDFPSYKPHITISYNVGDIDLPTLSDEDKNRVLYIDEEYMEDLDLSWTSK